MFVDGDLVPQSTSNMPNKHITIKFRFKFKQKSIAEAVSKEKRCISTILQPPFQPGNNIVQMPLQCDSSLFLSGFQLRQLRSTVSQSHHRRYSSKNKRKRCNASRKKKYKKKVYKTNSPGKSSRPGSIPSPSYLNSDKDLCNDNLHTQNKDIFWEETKLVSKIEKIKPTSTYEVLPPPTFVCNSLHGCSSRYARIYIWYLIENIFNINSSVYITYLS